MLIQAVNKHGKGEQARNKNFWQFAWQSLWRPHCFQRPQKADQKGLQSCHWQDCKPLECQKVLVRRKPFMPFG
jgi:hypothetical protein